MRNRRDHAASGLELAWRAHAAQEAWTAKVDAKAAIVLALEVAVLAAAVGALGGDGALADLPQVGAILVRGAALLLTVAIIFAGLGVLPLLGSSTGHAREYRDNLIYFGHLRHWQSTDDLVDRLQRLTDHEQLDQLARQLHRMSVANWRKHRALQASILTALPATFTVAVLAFWPS